MTPLRLVFLGSDAIALPMLRWLTSAEAPSLARIAAVYTQPDRPVGRGQKITANAIKTWALEQSLPVYQPEKLTPEATAEFIAARYDLALVMAYGHLLRDDFIAAPRLGTLNLHASLLPKYRGASPIQTAIAAGERETGVSLMRIVRRMDAGPVADVERVAIAPADTALEIEAKLANACPRLLARSLPRAVDGSLGFAEQDDAAATYCRKLEKFDGVLDFAASARQLAARINGLFPWPSCSVDVGGMTLKWGRAVAEEGGAAPVGAAPGTILAPDREAVRVATADGVLRVLQLQRPGGKMLPAAEFLRGAPLAPGGIVPSQAMPALVSATPFKKQSAH